MASRTKEDISGTRIIVENGKVQEIIATGCPVGTSISVDRIFDAVPVRKKFLKRDLIEQGYCMDALTRLALSHLGLRMRVATHGREILNIPASKELSERISLVLGAEFMEQSVSVSGTREKVTLQGFISRPGLSKSNAKQLYFYVNRRFVKDYLLNHAVMTAYKRIIEARRYPAAVLFIGLPPEDVDVNVHPAKMEVRFRNPRELYEMVVEAIMEALSQASPISDKISFSIPEKKMGLDDYHARIEEALRRYALPLGKEKLLFEQSFGKKEDDRNAGEKTETTIITVKPVAEVSLRFSTAEYLGQIFGTYLVFSEHDALVLVDQHAAHERILFEQLKKASSNERVASQRLLIPEVFSLSPRDFSFLMDCVACFEEIGMEVEHFGGDTVVVKATPAFLSQLGAKELIMDFVEAFSEAERKMSLADKRDKIFALLACKGAVKANQRLSSAEVSELCKSLDAIPFSATCPHGRPVWVSFSGNDIERMFKRK
jgi:DNA mismatch repair protein MutL